MHFTYLLRVDSKNQYFTGLLSPAQANLGPVVSKLLLVMPFLLRLSLSPVPHNKNLNSIFFLLCIFFTLWIFSGL